MFYNSTYTPSSLIMSRLLTFFPLGLKVFPGIGTLGTNLSPNVLLKTYSFGKLFLFI